jgi:hypothetical protein
MPSGISAPFLLTGEHPHAAANAWGKCRHALMATVSLHETKAEEQSSTTHTKCISAAMRRLLGTAIGRPSARVGSGMIL